MHGLINLFPTPIYKQPATIYNYDNIQIEVRDCLNTILEKDDLECVSYIYKDAGERKRNRPESGYYISDQLIEKYQLTNLKKRIHEAVDHYISLTQWSLLNNSPILNTIDGPVFQIKNSWINITEKGIFHDYHVHPQYTISGVYYFRVNADQGGIQFRNPNIMLENCYFPEGPRSPQSIEIIPQDGDIILFPAWLAHSTVKNTSDEDRVSIAFNLDLVTQNQT
jgi:uncharacterized protein (TIGR02466 family)